MLKKFLSGEKPFPSQGRADQAKRGKCREQLGVRYADTLSSRKKRQR